MITTIRSQIRHYQWLAAFLVFLGLGGFFGWAALASISGAVVAAGTVVVESATKKIQHLDGGIVAEIMVKNGDRVRQGDVIARLDDTETRASLEVNRAQLAELEARRSRLMAERDNKTSLERPAQLLSGSGPDTDAIWDGQARLLKARLEARTGKKQQFEQKVGQLSEAIRGLEAQKVSVDRQIELMAKELGSLRSLEKDRLVSLNRILNLERQDARLAGERGQIIAEIAKSQVQINETNLQLIEIDQKLLEEVLTELREVETKIAELVEKQTALAERLARVTITAPRAGFIHKLTITTVNGVVAPGEVIGEIVPEEDRLVIDGRIDPMLRDRVAIGQEAVIRFSSFDQNTTPELKGEVTGMSPDTKQDRPDLPHYFLVRIVLKPGEIERLNGQRLSPGMPAEVFIRTGERTALSYLVKPFTDQLARALTER